MAQELRQRAGAPPPAPPHDEYVPAEKPVSPPIRHTAGDYAICALLFVGALAVRLYRLDSPPEVVFDEVHFGKYAAYYMRGEFFFDVHPPLARLLVALSAWLAGFDGSFEFDDIGLKYADYNVPYLFMRGFQACIGALTVPLVFLTLRATGGSLPASLLSAFFLLIDNAHVTQTRFILLDAPLVLFMLCSLYAYVRFYAMRYNPRTLGWWGWMAATGVSLALTLSCKMVGLFGFCTVGTAVVADLWDLLDIRRGLTLRQFVRHFCARALGLIFLPLFVYLATFWVHFAMLPKSGTGDSFMSAQFQESLQGNELLSEAIELHAFDNITLRHRGTDVFLHSNLETYPLKYDDGRISSEGQQVTGVSESDDGSVWQIIPTAPVDNDDGSFNATKRTIRHRQHIRLLHVATQSYLRTHDVAAPLMPTNEEFTTVPADELHEALEDTLFEFSIDGQRDGSTKTWHSRSTWFRLIHVPTRVGMWTYRGAELPEWGHGHYEVNGNKNALATTTLWYVHDVYPDPASPMHAQRVEKPPPRERRHVDFMDKFAELQQVMLAENAALTEEHPYSSRPISWPFLLSGVSYWNRENDNVQVQFFGNVVTWWTSTAAIALFVGIAVADALLRRRGIYQIPTAVRNRLYKSTGFFALAWAFHYLPFFLMNRQLFLHHYLPAYVCALLVLGGVLDFFAGNAINYPVSVPGPELTPERRRPKLRLHQTRTLWAVCAALAAAALGMFVFLAPFTYAIDLGDADRVLRRRILPSWTLHYSRP